MRAEHHLPEELVVAFLTGRAADDERARVEQHIDECATCRELVSALAATSSAASSSPLPSPESEHGPISDGVVPSETPSLLPGDRVDDRFVLIEHAGKGGMGHVYRARDEASGAVVALKTMRLAEADGELARRFEREARVLEELNDPAVVRYVARGTMADGQAYLVMDWVEGESLALRLRRGPLDVPATLHLVRRIAGGLAAAHARGIVHRDVKPANVLLPDGDVERAVLIDFGIARTQRPGTAATRRGAFLGTPGYMAPEQTRGGGALDARADIFSLGCLAYECLTGAVPFAGSDFLESLAKLLLETPRPASEKAPGVPPALDALLARMLAKEPDERPADGAALAAELAQLSSSPAAITAPPPARTTSRAPLGGRSRRAAARTALTAAAALAIVALAGGGAVAWWRHAHPHLAATGVADGGRDASDDGATGKTVVLVLGIENRTMNVEMDGTADAIFATGLSSATTVETFTGPDVRGRLAAVAPGGTHIDEESARALAVKEHRRVVVVRGSVASREGGYDLTLEARNPTTNALLLQSSDRPDDPAGLVRTLTERACQLRHDLGDPETACTPSMSTSLEADHEVMLGGALGDSGQYDDALAHYRHALSIDPSFTRARLYLAMELKNIGRRADALTEYEAVLARPAGLSPRALVLAQGDADELRGDFAAAVALLKEQMLHYPGDAALVTRLTNSYAGLARWDDALTVARRAVEDHPRAVVLQANVLYYELGGGDLQGVVRDSQKIIDTAHVLPMATYFFRGLALALLGDDPGARAAIEGLKKQARLPGAMLEADLDAARGEGARGIAALETALAAKVEDDGPEETAAAWATLAALELDAGDRPGALTAAGRAGDSKTDHTLWTIAKVYVASGRLAEATAIAERLAAMPAPLSRMVGLCVQARIAASRHDARTRLAKARAAVTLHEDHVSRFELAQALLAAKQPEEARPLLETNRARPWEGSIPFDDAVSALRDQPPVEEALARSLQRRPR